jgi:hypothetical protein
MYEGKWPGVFKSTGLLFKTRIGEIVILDAVPKKSINPFYFRMIKIRTQSRLFRSY